MIRILKTMMNAMIIAARNYVRIGMNSLYSSLCLYKQIFKLTSRIEVVHCQPLPFCYFGCFSVMFSHVARTLCMHSCRNAVNITSTYQICSSSYGEGQTIFAPYLFLITLACSSRSIWRTAGLDTKK